MDKAHIEIPIKKIVVFCKKWKIRMSGKTNITKIGLFSSKPAEYFYREIDRGDV